MTMRKPPRRQSLGKRIERDKYLILMVIPPLLFFVVFRYIPILGNIIAFKDYISTKGFLGSEWVGLMWFKQFFSGFYFFRTLRNTFLLSFYNLLWSFPIPIIFALLINEFRDGFYKRAVQTISCMPHFISLTIIVGIMADMVDVNGVFNQFMGIFGFAPADYMMKNSAFRTMYIASGIWQSFGYNAIVYLAALSGIDPTLYEAAAIDGAKRWQMLIHISLPCILPTAVILLIMNCGRMLNVGVDKILLMYSPAIYETSDVFSSYVYRRGILSSDFSFATAVGLFEAVVNITVLSVVNWISRKVSETSLW
jgi:putative aldouronate transport system permease protein